MKNNSFPQSLRVLVAEWITRAQDDHATAVGILRHREGAPAHVCFLAQQMAEKYLKALLLFYSHDYPKTHDLHQLATLSEAYVKDLFSVLQEEIVLLAAYYVGTRYPADIPLESFSWEVAQEALEAAERLQKFVLEKISL
jgi:HEPN domain-containing protein